MKKIIAIFLGVIGVGMLGTGAYLSFADTSYESNNKNNGNVSEKEEEKKDDTKDTVSKSGKWGTFAPIKFEDKQYGQIEITVRGTYAYKIPKDYTNIENLEKLIVNDIIVVISSSIAKQKGESYVTLTKIIESKKEEFIKNINDNIKDPNCEVTEIEILSIDVTDEYKDIINGEKEDDVIKDNEFNTKFDNYRMKATSTITMSGMETIAISEGVVDEKNQKQYLKTTTTVMGIDVVTETYSDFNNGITYTSVPFTSTWEKSNGASEFVDLANMMVTFEENGDVTKVSDNHYKIKMSPSDIEGLLSSNDTTGAISRDIYVDAYVNNGYITKLEYDFSGMISGIEKYIMVIEFFDFNNAGDVVIPNEVMQ